MTIGSLMLDLQGTELTVEEIDMLQHPLTGGVILFSRNFKTQIQIHELCKNIRKMAGKPILIAVDQEGGRVQRFHEKFTTIPAMGSFRHRDMSEEEILQHLAATGWLMASELISSGVDISFAPILDIDIGVSQVIGDRGFSDQPKQIIDYSTAFIKGMNSAGMSATGKHFPGHGSTIADSHFELPIDCRTMEQIREVDLSIFVALCKQGLSAIMPAHVIYSEVDPLPACFSSFWLQHILRGELNFQGTIFSDDLSMAGAKSMGDILSRAKEALSAGCDMILCCNDIQSTTTLIDQLPQKNDAEKVARIQRMISKNKQGSFEQLQATAAWQETNRMISQLEDLS